MLLTPSQVSPLPLGSGLICQTNDLTGVMAVNFETFLTGFVVGFLFCGWLLSASRSSESSLAKADTESQLAEYQRLLLMAQTQQQITDVTTSTRNNQAIHSLNKSLNQISGGF